MVFFVAENAENVSVIPFTVPAISRIDETWIPGRTRSEPGHFDGFAEIRLHDQRIWHMYGTPYECGEGVRRTFERINNLATRDNIYRPINLMKVSED